MVPFLLWHQKEAIHRLLKLKSTRCSTVQIQPPVSKLHTIGMTDVSMHVVAQIKSRLIFRVYRDPYRTKNKKRKNIQYF
jgi:hypothetical protein